MSGPLSPGTGFLPEPIPLILAAMSAAAPLLGTRNSLDAIDEAAPTRSQQRRLAAAPMEDPLLLTSGRPEGPPQVERLIRGMIRRGAGHLPLPRCQGCGRTQPLIHRQGPHPHLRPVLQH